MTNNFPDLIPGFSHVGIQNVLRPYRSLIVIGILLFLPGKGTLIKRVYAQFSPTRL